MGPEGQEYMRRKRQQAERTAAMAAHRVSWEEELKEARKQRVNNNSHIVSGVNMIL